MKKVTSADNIVTINHYKNILESEGIPCVIRNQHLGSILGEMPFPDVWPQLWVKTQSCKIVDASEIVSASNDWPASTAGSSLALPSPPVLSGVVGPPDEEGCVAAVKWALRRIPRPG